MLRLSAPTRAVLHADIKTRSRSVAFMKCSAQRYWYSTAGQSPGRYNFRLGRLLRALLGPVPITPYAADEIMDWTSLVAVLEGWHFVLLENLESLEHSHFDLVNHHAGEHLSLPRIEVLEKDVDRVLFGNESWRRALIPETCADQFGTELSLAFSQDTHHRVDHSSVDQGLLYRPALHRALHVLSEDTGVERRAREGRAATDAPVRLQRPSGLTVPFWTSQGNSG